MAWKLNVEGGEGLWLQLGVSTQEKRADATGAHRRRTGKLQVQLQKQLYCELRVLPKVLAKKRHETVSKEAISCCLLPVVFKKIGL